jgi:spore maturation protein CgeB
LFKNYKEAVFFNNYDDCIKKIKLLLSNDQLRKKITKKGYEKIQKMKKGLSFEYNIKKIISGLNFD